MALGCRHLQRVEQAWRDMNSDLGLLRCGFGRSGDRLPAPGGGGASHAPA